jgi:hypothetical protein
MAIIEAGQEVRCVDRNDGRHRESSYVHHAAWRELMSASGPTDLLTNNSEVDRH